MTVSVGFIGVGNMGNPMAMNLLKKGYALTVYDLDAGAMKNLVAAGARGAASTAEAVAGATVVFTSLPGTPQVEVAYLGAGGLVDRAAPGATLIDLSSVLPSTPKKIEAQAKARGLSFLEAPVSGGVTGAAAATLAVMTGGDPAVLEKVRPLLDAIGKNIYHVGAAGAANTIKAINNMMSTVNACAMMEGLIVGLKAGLDLKTMGDIIKNSSGNSNALARVDRALIPRNFAPGFKVALMNKDLDTFHAIARDVHAPTSFSNMAQHYQQTALAAGYSEMDTSIIFTLIEQQAGLAQ